MRNIEILGEPLEGVKVKGFKLPKTAHMIDMLPDFLSGVFTRAVNFKPVINEGLCEKCGVCKNSCPVEAITINKKASFIDEKVCIRCFCCHEVCPYRAVYIKRNFIANLLWRE